jgi:hypothetical protein
VIPDHQVMAAPAGFFYQHVGSVAGVLLTAFLLIPNLTNFRALLDELKWDYCRGMSYFNREIQP